VAVAVGGATVPELEPAHGRNAFGIVT
jgi:hypothetical protein